MSGRAPDKPSPSEIAQQCVQAALNLAEGGHGTVLSMGENHDIFSHQVTEALALKELVTKGQNVTLFMEIPGNRLYTILLDRGYDADKALKLAEHISTRDPDGHMTAKAIIGGNPGSLRGGNFHRFGTHMLLQTAIHHGTGIIYADAARVYPEDFCMDYSDPSTNRTALKLNVRKGPARKMGPDDMLIRNSHMSGTIKAKLEKTVDIGLLQNGAAHGFGVDDKGNGLHHYRDSLAKLFQKMELPAVMVSMVLNHAMPPDYKNSDSRQIRLFKAPVPPTLTKDMSDSEINDFLAKNRLDPNLYNPKKFVENYRAEFDDVIRRAETALGFTTPASRSLPTSTRASQPSSAELARTASFFETLIEDAAGHGPAPVRVAPAVSLSEEPKAKL